MSRLTKFSRLNIHYSLLYSLLGIAICLILSDILLHFLLPNTHIIVQQFNIAIEKNIPTLFSTLNLMLAGYLLKQCYKLSNKKTPPSPLSFQWYVLSILFYFLAFDEWISIHDVVGKLLGTLFPESLFNFFGWTLAYIFICSGIFVYFFKFLIALPKKTSISFVVCGALFLTGAIGFEIVGKKIPDFHYFAGIIEESLEMISICLFNISIFYTLKTTLSLQQLSIKWSSIALFTLLGTLDIIGTYIFN